RPAKKAIVMISPRETRSGPETLGDERLVVIDCRDGVEPSRHRRRTVRISEHRGLFRGKEKWLARCVIADVPRSRLGTQPFTKLSLVEACLFGQLLRSRRAN